ncbi:MAG: iron chelate uptake ABC transporter family permease subunit [Bacteroidota bacterium]
MEGMFWDFFLLRDANAAWVLLGMICICVSSALIGCFTFLKKQSLAGDAIAHAILPGVCLAFMWFETKSPFVLLGGAVVSGWLGMVGINQIQRYTRLKSDAALALILSVFYGLGILLLTVIQRSGNAAQSGLDKFLFGKAASMVKEDVQIFLGFSLLIMVVVLLSYKPLKLVIFDPDFARAIGVNVKVWDFLVSFLTVIAIALGVQAVGVVLMSALLIAPATAARYWTRKLSVMLVLAALFAAIGGVIGAYISYTIPRMPTGPWVVAILSFLAIFSVLIGLENGYIRRLTKNYSHSRKMLEENILKCMYHLGEPNENFLQPYSLTQLQERRYIETARLEVGIRRLKRKGWVKRNDGGVFLTEVGLEEGRRVVRIHRLWEVYLSTYMQLPADHVHDNAEAMEHVITPEIERELEHQLAYPTKDPHASPIPYRKD